MAGKGKKGKSKGGNKPKAQAQAPKATPAVETGAAAAATNSSTPIESELITPGALDAKLSDPAVAAVAGQDVEDKAAPSVEKEAAAPVTDAAAAAPAATVVEEKQEAPVAAAETLQKEEPVVAEEAQIPASEYLKKEAPVAAVEEQREAPIAAEKLQKDAPLPAAVGAQKDVSAPAAESKQAPIIGGASAVPLAAGVASTQNEMLANNNPFTSPAAAAAPVKETSAVNSFDTPAVAAPVKDVPTPASKTEAVRDLPIHTKETAPAAQVQQPEAAVPSHVAPPASTNPYTSPLKTSNEAVAQSEKVSAPKKVAGDGFEPAPVSKPTPPNKGTSWPEAPTTTGAAAPAVVEDTPYNPPAPATPAVVETTPYQPPAPAAAVPQQETARAPAPAAAQAAYKQQGQQDTTPGAAGVRSPSPASPHPHSASATPLTELKLMQTSASDAEPRSGCCIVQ